MYGVSSKTKIPTWLITGGSSGLGLDVAKTALATCDNLAVTSRNASRLKELKHLGAHTISLDIAGPEDGIIKVVDEVVQKYGAIDILLNNAGYIFEGAVEEVR